MGFPDKVKLDLAKLTVHGHSFGGITALESAVKDQRIKCCVPMDAWFQLRKE
jgi:predicted dienelactone hydrolase